MVSHVTFTELQAAGAGGAELESALKAAQALSGTDDRRDRYVIKYDDLRFMIFEADAVESSAPGLLKHIDPSVILRVPRCDTGTGKIVSSDLREGRMSARAALHGSLVAKHGQEANVIRFIDEACAMIADEHGTLAWHGISVGPGEFALVEFFSDEQARDEHMNADAAKSLMAKAATLFVRPPEIRFGRVI